ncbi:tetratricopeptide repeat protein [Streptomyces sp. NPDC059166]|uniref:tetratricopeptide repeat protein n=1 Tax=Streptomyces sp. NPDC059166 TaxID=3346752 RepID=UPI0036B632C7
MSSPRNRRPTSPELTAAWECLDGGDVPGALRALRQVPSAPLGEVAMVVGRAAETGGFDDLAGAAGALAERPDDVRAMYDYGYACVERGVPYLAIPALREALRLVPGSAGLLRELVSAYEREGRHRDAADVLLAHEDGLADWPDRYLLVFNAVLAGDLELARLHHGRLGTPDGELWLGARDRQNLLFERAADVASVSPLDATDLRGWQYVMGGTVLGTLSPYGFEVGMTGRYAWIQDSHEMCLHGLLRLRASLGVAGVRPRSVSLLPDRGSRILGLAAAEVLGLPAVSFEAGREDTVVIAYDLDETARADGGGEVVRQLFDRTPGQVLHEHASCWTDPPAVAADSVTFLYQSVVAPWGARLLPDAGGGLERGEADGRPEAEIAAEIVAADPKPDDGDGATPADPDEALTAFVAGVRGTWLRGQRAGLHSAGPVGSSRFV